MSSDLPLDIIASISVIINRAYFPLFSKQIAYAFNLLIFCKFYIVLDILSRIDKIFSIQQQYQHIVDIFKLFVKILMCAHFMAILYHVKINIITPKNKELGTNYTAPKISIINEILNEPYIVKSNIKINKCVYRTKIFFYTLLNTHL